MHVRILDIEDDEDNYMVQILHGNVIVYESKIQSFEVSPQVLADMIIFHTDSEKIQ